MKIYLVGGAIRDEFLGVTPKERDWVVIGSTPEEMISLGYKPIGKDFPVFLHPETSEEYALARTERKVSPGYHGFEFFSAPNVTLEEDLMRRDITINAIAKSAEGKIIDPFNGRGDIKARIMKHVSPAFIEDPVRVLRVARFAARFYSYDFKVHDELYKIMVDIVKNKEIDALSPDRVWKEFALALMEDSPDEFFNVLKKCGADSVLFTGVRKSERYSINSNKEASLDVRYVCFANMFNEQSFLYSTMNVPGYLREMSELVEENFLKLQKFSGNPEQILEVLESLDAMRRPERLDIYLKVVSYLCQNIKNYEVSILIDGGADFNAALHVLLRESYDAIGRIETKEFTQGNKSGESIKRAKRKVFLEAIDRVINQHK
jgi:tRNA nucleotidyltransferase (CCA-adding enzyme)